MSELSSDEEDVFEDVIEYDEHTAQSPIPQSNDQSIHQSNDPSEHPLHQLDTHSTDRSDTTYTPVIRVGLDQPISHITDQTTAHSKTIPSNQSFDLSNRIHLDQSIDQSHDQSIHQSTSFSVSDVDINHSNEQFRQIMLEQVNNHSSNQPTIPPFARQLTVEQIEQAEQNRRKDSESVSQSANQSVNSSPNQSPNQSSPSTPRNFFHRLFHRKHHSPDQSTNQSSNQSSNASSVSSTPRSPHSPRSVQLSNNQPSYQSSPSSSPPSPSHHVKVKTSHRSASLFAHQSSVQSINQSTGPLWSLAWSFDGQMLAVAGQDSILRIFLCVTVENEKLIKEIEAREESNNQSADQSIHQAINLQSVHQSTNHLLYPIPYRLFSGHKGDITCLSWSNSNFLLSSSLDRTCRLWHPTRTQCLTTFAHTDYVTAVKFHPNDEKLFVSSTFDCKLRIWQIISHRVIEWCATARPVTALAWHAAGVIAAGIDDGTVCLYSNQLKYIAEVTCRARRGKYANGSKVSGIEFSGARDMLVTTNDSRVRLFDWTTRTLRAKFKGFANRELHLAATFVSTEEGLFVMAPSEDHYVYAWHVPTKGSEGVTKVSSYEAFKASSVAVTVVSPLPHMSLNAINEYRQQHGHAQFAHPVVAATSFDGVIKLFTSQHKHPHADVTSKSASPQQPVGHIN